MSLSHRLLSAFDLPLARKLVWASGFFSLVLIAGLCHYGLTVRPMLHFDPPNLLNLREAIVADPSSETLKQDYRAQDVLLRQAYFHSRSRLRTGAWLLFVSASVFVLSLRRVATLTRKEPAPLPPRLLDSPRSTRPATLLALLAIPLPVALGVVAAFSLQGKEVSGDSGSALATLESVPESERWIQFRGNNGNGTSPDLALPVAWDGEKGEGVLWKSELPLGGNSSPIVFGDKIFLTGADLERRVVYGFDLKTGALLWECPVRTAATIDEDMIKTARTTDTGFGSPSPVTDGNLVFALFGTNELVAVDSTGKQVWARWFGKPESDFGISTSLRYHQGKLILQLDQGEDDNPNSFLYALNPADGEILWKTPRPVGDSWSTPLIAETPTGPQVFTIGNPWFIAYDAVSGKELWRAEVFKGDPAPLPVYGKGRVFGAVEYSCLAAVRTEGQGTVTESHVDWKFEDDLPDIPSLLTDGDFVLVPTSWGKMTCLRATDGEMLWEESLEGEFWSSPTLIGANVYWTSTEGVTSIFVLGEKYTPLGQAALGERVVASPAFLSSRIVFRADSHLYLLGSQP